MEEETLKQSADRLKNFQGNAKGEVFRMHAQYIKSKEGEEGLKKLEKRMEELGVPIDIENVKPFEWKSEGISALIILTSKEVFGWTKEDVFQMGRFAPRFSFVLKVMAQYLISIETLFKNSPKYWKKNYDFGKIEPIKIDMEKQELIVREIGIATHPLVCVYHAGYFKGISEFVLGGKEATVKETACVHEGADYHEFLLSWK